MEIYIPINKILERIVEKWESISGIIDSVVFSRPLILLQVIIGVISVALITGIIYLILNSDIIKLKLSKIRTFLFQAHLEDKEFIISWKKIIKMARSNNSKKHREAIILADDLANDVLADIAILGKDLEEKLENAGDRNISNIPELISASQKAKELSDDEGILIGRKEAIEILVIYEKLLREIGIF